MEENRQPLTKMAIEKHIQLLRSKNVGEDVLALVRSDLEDGLTEEETALYVNKNYNIGQMRVLSECIHKGISVHFRCANVLDELPKLAEAGEKFDVVILDPPAFTKSREATKNAIKGYREINMKGLKLVKDGGYLATCSCSHFMTQELFTKTIREAARSSHKRLRQIEFRTQAADHPILWAADESYYLKFFIFQVVDEK